MRDHRGLEHCVLGATQRAAQDLGVVERPVVDRPSIQRGMYDDPVEAGHGIVASNLAVEPCPRRRRHIRHGAQDLQCEPRHRPHQREPAREAGVGPGESVESPADDESDHATRGVHHDVADRGVAIRDDVQLEQLDADAGETHRCDGNARLQLVQRQADAEGHEQQDVEHGVGAARGSADDAEAVDLRASRSGGQRQ